MPHQRLDGRLTMRTLLLKCIVLTGLAAGLAPAPAAEPTLNSSPAKGKAGGPLLTRAELRECMSRKERTQVQSDETVRLQAELEKDKAEVQQLRAALNEKLAALDRTSAEAVAAYNEQAKVFDQRVDGYNAKTPAFNAKAEALKNDRETYAKSCENRRFDEKDEIAIKSGK